MTAADASPSPGSPSSKFNTTMRSNIDPMGTLGNMGSSLGPLSLGGVGTVGRMATTSEQRRPGSGEVFPSDLQVLDTFAKYQHYLIRQILYLVKDSGVDLFQTLILRQNKKMTMKSSF